MIGGNLGAAVQMLKVMNQQSGGGQSWEPEYTALLSALTGTAPDFTTKTSQNAFIKYLKGGNSDSRNTWAKLSCIIPYFAGMPTAADALIWWNDPTRKGVLSTHAPEYILLEGFVGDKTNHAYIDTTWNPSTEGGSLYTLNKCSVGFWIRNLRAKYSTLEYHGNANTYINPLAAYQKTYIGINENTGYQFTNITGSNYLFTLNRRSATTINYCLDRVISSDIANDNTSITNLSMYNLASHMPAGADYYANDTIGLFFAGDELDQIDLNVLCDAIDNLLFAINSATALFDYPADGNTIDPGIWTIVNPNPTSVSFIQNNAIIMQSLGVSSAAGANYINTAFSMNYGIFAGSLVDLYKPTQYRSVTYSFGAANFFAIQRYGGLNQNLYFRIHNGKSYVYALDIGEYEFVIFKIKYTPTHAFHFYKWANDAWVLVGSCTTLNVIGNLTGVEMTSTGYEATETHLRDIYITKRDFNTMIP